MSISRCVLVSTDPITNLVFLPLVAKVKKMKTNIIKFRCTLYEKKLLKVKALKSGLNLSEFCRKSIFEKEIKERLSEEQIEFYKMLVKYHNNFKSISNLYKKKDTKMHLELIQLADKIKTHLQNFK